MTASEVMLSRTDTVPIIERVARRFALEPDVILGRSRRRSVAYARQVVYWALREAGWSYHEIGSIVGRDHTTVIYGVAAIEEQRRLSSEFALELESLRGAPAE